MTTQSEQILEQELLNQLQTLEYKRVNFNTEEELLANLKKNIEEINGVQFSEAEFLRILNTLSKGSIYEKAGRLRQKLDYQKDDGKTGYIDLLNTEDWCKNNFQVTNQITVDAKYKHRYDVTLLINGFPLVQIELKRRGIEIK